MKKIPVFIFSCFILALSAQPKNEYLLEMNGFAGSEKNLPFWMVSNQNGKVRNADHASLFGEWHYSSFNDSTSTWNLYAGASVLGFTQSNRNKLEINTAYVTGRFKKLLLTLGSLSTPQAYGGLSSTNGNILTSGNARPVPGIWLETAAYWRVPFTGGKLQWKAKFGNGLLFDDRWVEDAQLHHKNLYFKWHFKPKWALIIGTEDYAIWGGTSRSIGSLPKGFDDFLRVIGGLSGSTNSPEGDAINALGNHVGAYRLELTRKSQKLDWNLYWSHPFEDRSGRELNNIEDGLWGLFLDFKNPDTAIHQLLFEFTYTKDQSGKGQIDGFDDFFNNTIYRSGFTFFGRSMGSPFFTPQEKDENGITPGIQNNSFIAWHMGVKGKLARNLHYKTLHSLSFNEGTKSVRFENSKTQYSGLFEAGYLQANWPVEVALGIGWDSGSLFENNVGVFVKIIKKGVF